MPSLVQKKKRERLHSLTSKQHFSLKIILKTKQSEILKNHGRILCWSNEMLEQLSVYLGQQHSLSEKTECSLYLVPVLK